ncbi:MAG: hypothetical protein Q3972_07465 [Corynebacterium sp.]|nr:hypothetical protein [Corynebacterium sp.]
MAQQATHKNKVQEALEQYLVACNEVIYWEMIYQDQEKHYTVVAMVRALMLTQKLEKRYAECGFTTIIPAEWENYVCECPEHALRDWFEGRDKLIAATQSWLTEAPLDQDFKAQLENELSVLAEVNESHENYIYEFYTSNEDNKLMDVLRLESNSEPGLLRSYNTNIHRFAARAWFDLMRTVQKAVSLDFYAPDAGAFTKAHELQRNLVTLGFRYAIVPTLEQLPALLRIRELTSQELSPTAAQQVQHELDTDLRALRDHLEYLAMTSNARLHDARRMLQGWISFSRDAALGYQG